VTFLVAKAAQPCNPKRERGRTLHNTRCKESRVSIRPRSRFGLHHPDGKTSQPWDERWNALRRVRMSANAGLLSTTLPMKGDRLMRFTCSLRLLVACLVTTSVSAAEPLPISLRGEIRDADSDQLLPARLYIQSADGAKWFFAKSADLDGSAIVYDRARG